MRNVLLLLATVKTAWKSFNFYFKVQLWIQCFVMEIIIKFVLLFSVRTCFLHFVCIYFLCYDEINKYWEKEPIISNPSHKIIDRKWFVEWTSNLILKVVKKSILWLKTHTRCTKKVINFKTNNIHAAINKPSYTPNWSFKQMQQLITSNNNTSQATAGRFQRIH